jgi:hypothetical protein
MAGHETREVFVVQGANAEFNYTTYNSHSEALTEAKAQVEHSGGVARIWKLVTVVTARANVDHEEQKS